MSGNRTLNGVLYVRVGFLWIPTNTYGGYSFEFNVSLVLSDILKVSVDEFTIN